MSIVVYFRSADCCLGSRWLAVTIFYMRGMGGAHILNTFSDGVGSASRVCPCIASFPSSSSSSPICPALLHARPLFNLLLSSLCQLFTTPWHEGETKASRYRHCQLSSLDLPYPSTLHHGYINFHWLPSHAWAPGCLGGISLFCHVGTKTLHLAFPSQVRRNT